VEALNDLAKKKRAKASKSSPEKIQPLVPKLDLSLVQVRSSLHATPCSTSHVGRRVIFSLIESGVYRRNSSIMRRRKRQEAKGNRKRWRRRVCRRLHLPQCARKWNSSARQAAAVRSRAIFEAQSWK
jgi:hypothetical protein